MRLTHHHLAGRLEDNVFKGIILVILFIVLGVKSCTEPGNKLTASEKSCIPSHHQTAQI